MEEEIKCPQCGKPLKHNGKAKHYICVGCVKVYQLVDLNERSVLDLDDNMVKTWDLQTR